MSEQRPEFTPPEEGAAINHADDHQSEVESRSRIVTVRWPAILDEDPRRLAEQILDQWSAADWDQRPPVDEFAHQLEQEIAALRNYRERIAPIITQIASVIEEEYSAVVPAVRDRPPIIFELFGPHMQTLTGYRYMTHRGGMWEPAMRRAFIVNDDLNEIPIYRIAHELSHAYADKTIDPKRELRSGFGAITPEWDPLPDNDPDLNEGVTTLFGHRLAERWQERFGQLPDGMKVTFDQEDDYFAEWRLASAVEALTGQALLMRVYLTSDEAAHEQLHTVLSERFSASQLEAWRMLPADVRAILLQDEPVSLEIPHWDREQYEAITLLFPQLEITYLPPTPEFNP